jgi:hypothetical protein
MIVDSGRRNIWIGIVWLWPGLLFAQEMPETLFDDVIDSPMYQAPALPVPAIVRVFPENAKLWLKSLERPETDMRYKAAEAIALARRQGMRGLETTIVPLQAAFKRSDQDAAVRLAIAEALIALEARDTADSFLSHARSGSVEMRNIVEPALARWHYQPAREMWLERLKDPATPARSLVLAVRGLVAVRDPRATDPLRQLLLSEGAPGFVRVEAARALAQLRHEGLEAEAERLAGSTSRQGIAGRLAAVALLTQHRGDRAVTVLQRLLMDSEAAVAAAAVARLLEIDAGLLTDKSEYLMAHSDAKLRRYAVEVLARFPSAANVRRLGDRLGDSHTEVRRHARRALHESAAKKELLTAVIAEGERMLASDRWQALEQAIILLAQLQHKAVASRLMELLSYDRPEVCLTAAWGLRKLAVPETLSPAARYADAQRQRVLNGMKRGEHPAVPEKVVEYQLAQLNQLLGEQRYRPADTVLRGFIPKRVPLRLTEARVAAIWSLGLIHDGTKVADLAADLEARLTERPRPPPPEDARVRAMSAISLGRLRAALPTLRKFCPTQQASQDRLTNACGWAIEQITGERLRMALPVSVKGRWFLEPNE